MKRLEIALGVGAAGAVIAILWDPFIGAFLHRERYRDEIRTLDQSLQPGMTKDQVRQVMDSGRYPNLRFDRGPDELWSAEAPLEFGAGNWMLLIGFHGEQVSMMRVRTADGIHDHPAEAPPDRVRSVTPAPPGPMQ